MLQNRAEKENGERRTLRETCPYSLLSDHAWPLLPTEKGEPYDSMTLWAPQNFPLNLCQAVSGENHFMSFEPFLESQHFSKIPQPGELSEQHKNRKQTPSHCTIAHAPEEGR